MRSSTKLVTIESEGLTVSLLVWRLFRRKPEGYVERVYEMNPGLADVGPVLPVGIQIVFPLDAPSTAPRRRVVRLWG
ncbi:MAG: phage tail protein [Salinarimonadaceae bacterium]|nr:MAG: phage tail protein [Salinarimonadaceae bacterium]